MTASLPHEIEWLEPISPASPVPALAPALAVAVKRRFGGKPPAFIPRFTACPWAVQMLLGAIPSFTRISYRLGDLIFLVVSQDNSCRYCYGNARVLLRLNGFSEAEIRDVETDLMRADLPETDRLALDFVRALSRVSPRPGHAEIDALATAGVDPLAIAEIAAQGAFCVLSTRIATLTATAPAGLERLVDRWFTPALRLMMKIVMRKHRRLVPKVAMPAEALEGPMGPLFRRLDGIPQAVVLARALGEAFASPILPRRTKLMMVAVIGRAVQCGASEAAIRPMLEQEGVTDLDEILARLHTPSMTPLEAKLVPLARETTRYETPAMQRRMHALAGEVRDEEFLEFVAICALANALTRLTVVLDVS